MQKKHDIIRENELLKIRLQRAEIWMGRQIHESVRTIQTERSRKESRKRFENFLETDITDSISDRIDRYFWSGIEHAPPYTRERLLDSEIYWMTLQKHPTIDAFPIIASYQKILDAYFEERFTIPFRRAYEWKRITTPVEKGLESDIANVIHRGYTLSLGRWYQFFSSIRSHEWVGSFTRTLFEFIERQYPWSLEILMSEGVFSQFQILIDMEVFSRKRHDNKISFTDAKKSREILVGNYQEDGLLKYIFSKLS